MLRPRSLRNGLSRLIKDIIIKEVGNCLFYEGMKALVKSLVSFVSYFINLTLSLISNLPLTAVLVASEYLPGMALAFWMNGH